MAARFLYAHLLIRRLALSGLRCGHENQHHQMSWVLLFSWKTEEELEKKSSFNWRERERGSSSTSCMVKSSLNFNYLTQKEWERESRSLQREVNFLPLLRFGGTQTSTRSTCHLPYICASPPPFFFLSPVYCLHYLAHQIERAVFSNGSPAVWLLFPKTLDIKIGLMRMLNNLYL